MTTQLALWEPEPCHNASAPTPSAPRPTARQRLRERRIEPEAGRAAGSWRRWTPRGEGIRITTVPVPEEYL